MRKLVFSGIAAVFMVGAISQYCLAIEESQKNDAVSQYFASHELNPGTVWVIDKHDPMEATRFYTYSGLYYRATGKQNHCFIVNDNSGVDAALLTPEYNQAEAQIAEISNFIIVEPAEYGLSKIDDHGSIVIRKAVSEDLPRMQEIFALAQYDSIRIDTHRDNSVMRNALLREGYRYCGIIHCWNGSERLAYQLIAR